MNTNPSAPLSIEELEAAAFAAAETLAAARRKEKEEQQQREAAARSAAYLASQRKTHNAIRAHFAKVAEALAVTKVAVTFEDLPDDELTRASSPAPKFEVRAGSVAVYLRFDAGCRINRIIVNTIGRSEGNAFPQKADGTFSYAKIAQAMLDHLSSAERETERRAKEATARSSSAAIAEKLASEFAVTQYSNPSVSTSQYYADKVTVALNLSLTEERAREFLQLLVTFGAVKPRA